ncbi:hypothetical protein ASG87_17700 [Frateuria sp. Soil773]|uniref:DUF2974 domain-containing protein n=1 Tax=Frateuria sp. Soil773 TaxID=1736407 RepID=UPI0006F65578|nr:DUF2974 domain-containing protein [Frateuria sp. Soil773]KRE94438.1 hypothetical protein ASG87_17700 [Frateuria sp. Soil773]
MYLETQTYRNHATGLATDTASPAGAAPPAAAGTPHRSTPQLAFNPALAGLARQLFAGGNGAAAFDARVRGTDARSIDMQLARISQDVYDPSSRGIDGWQRLDDGQLRAAGIDPASLEDPSTGFRAAVYQDAGGNHVLAFAGSNDIKDWLDNARQGVGLPAAEYNQAVALATQAKVAFGHDLAIIGHSLGGGLASMAALATDTPAVTFNASGLNDATLRRLIPEGDPAALKRQAEQGLVRRYAVDGEVLTSAQEGTPLPDAVGHKIALHDPAPVAAPQLHWYDWLYGKAEVLEAGYQAAKLKHSVDLHMIDPVIDALGKDHPWTA